MPEPIVTRIKRLPGAARDALPHEQTKLSVPYHHTTSVRRDMLASLKHHVGFGICEERDGRVPLPDIITDRALHLPALFLRWRELGAGQPYGVPMRPYQNDLVAGTCLFTPKHKGTTTATVTGKLVDSASAFDEFRLKARVGDIAAVVQDQDDGTVDILAKTTITGVDYANKRLSVASNIFPAGTAYEIHRPQDIRRTYVTTRLVNVSLDLYADPDAADGAENSIEHCERLVRAWMESDVAQVILGRHETYLRREQGLMNQDLSDLLGDATASYLRRVVVDVPLAVGEIVEMPWPTIESIGATGVFRVAWDEDSPVLWHQTEEITVDDVRETLTVV